MADIKPQLKAIDKQIKEYWDEMQEVYKEYLDHKTLRWRNGFRASDWTYYNEFLTKADYEDWNDSSVCSYLNYLGSRIRNLKLKKNQIKWKNYGK